MQEVLPGDGTFDSGDAGRWNQLGVERRQQGDSAGALEAFERADALVPGRPEIILNCATVLSELGRTDEAAKALARAVELAPKLAIARVALAKLHLVSMRIDEAIAEFQAALQIEPENVAAHLGLYEALQVRGDNANAVAHQRRALAQQRLFVEQPARDGAPSILMVAVPGDWQANVPLEFLYSMMPIGVYKLFVDDALPPPDEIPRVDVVFNAVAQSDPADRTLAVLEGWLPRTGLPTINDPARVRLLSRDGVARDYADVPGAYVPTTRRVSRAAISSDPLVAGATPESPATIRPVDSQAGRELLRMERAADLDAYLESSAAEEFFVAPFVDYRAADGRYRKYRVIFVEGVPFAHHLAISDHWMVHYYNARNADEASLRAEEEAFLADISSVFDGPRAAALVEIARRANLDYFGMDCSIMPDGRVLVFEIDVAMIVHLGDPIETYPYKHRYVPRIYQAVERMIRSRA